MKASLPDLKEKLAILMGTASVSSVSEAFDMPNIAVIETLAEWFNALGFKTEIQEVIPGRKANLLATYGEGSGGLILAGHTDTVPFNESRWDYNPLGITEADNRFYGLGSCDMKGFFALVTEAVIPLLEQDFKHPLTILATADEESSMSGARALAENQFPNPCAAIIGEPTQLKPIRMHKSIMMNAIKLIGQSGHSSNPDLGINALDAMHDVITELKSFRSEIQAKNQNAEFAVAFPTMNLGCIHGGDNPNRICNACELHFDFRGLPGMDNLEVLKTIERRIQPIVDQHGVVLEMKELIGSIESFEQDKQSELVQLAEKLTGSEANAVAFATEAPFLKALNVETIVLGPGSIDQAHQPNEYLAFDQIEPCITLLRRFIKHYCL